MGGTENVARGQPYTFPFRLRRYVVADDDDDDDEEDDDDDAEDDDTGSSPGELLSRK